MNTRLPGITFLVTRRYMVTLGILGTMGIYLGTSAPRVFDWYVNGEASIPIVHVMLESPSFISWIIAAIFLGSTVIDPQYGRLEIAPDGLYRGKLFQVAWDEVVRVTSRRGLMGPTVVVECSNGRKLRLSSYEDGHLIPDIIAMHTRLPRP